MNDSSYSSLGRNVSIYTNPLIYLLMGVSVHAANLQEETPCSPELAPFAISVPVDYALPSEVAPLSEEDKMEAILHFANTLYAESRDLEPEIAELLERDFMSLI